MTSHPLITNLTWASRFVWRSGPALTILNIIFVLTQSILPLLGLYLLKLIIDEVSAGMTAPVSNVSFHKIGYLILLSGGVVLLERTLTTLTGLISSTQALAVTERVYEILHSKSLEMDLEYYENSDYYDTLHRAQHEAPHRPTRIVNGFLSFAQNSTSLIAIGALLVTFHWSVPVVLILSAIPGLLVRFRFAKRLYTWSRNRTPKERQAQYFNTILTGPRHAKEIRLFNLGNILVERFRTLNSQIRRERLSLMKTRSAAEVATHTGVVLPTFALYAFLAYRTLHGQMTIGDLVMFYQAMQRLQSHVQQCLGSIADLYENHLYLSNVLEFLALKPKIATPVRPKAIPERLREGIAICAVKFQYPNSESKILDGVDLVIRPGEHIALVGENGCGKTTLVKLLCRLYDPTEGVITFDRVDIRDLSLSALRRKIGIVFQDYARYYVTAKENVWFGNIELPLEGSSIVKAARQAGAHQVITKLKGGYDTLLGKLFENGSELSVGEWQKVALARAFLRDSEILILDEPTSAMDPKAEYELFKKFHELAKGRTAILISHRLSTVKMADRIYFLENGAVVEDGTHEELIHSRGKYAYMFERQAENYR